MNLQKLLEKWNIKCDINIVLSMWNESHRSYHNLDHLNDLIDQINEDRSEYTEMEFEKLILAALFHDCVYEPKNSDNEEKSASFFLESCSDKKNKDVLDIEKIILDTKTHESTDRLSKSFNKYDMNIVERDFDQLLDWEKGISEEYKGYGDAYKDGRLKFLESMLDRYPNNTENLLKLVDWVKENY